MANTENIQYRYNNVITLVNKFEEPELYEIEKIKNNLEVNVASNFYYQKETDHCVVDFEVNLSIPKYDFQILQFKNRHFFGIKSSESIITEDDKGEFVNFPEKFLVALTAIGYSTTRGIIIEKLAGTRFSDLMLPIINPRELAPTDKVRVLDIDKDEE